MAIDKTKKLRSKSTSARSTIKTPHAGAPAVPAIPKTYTIGVSDSTSGEKIIIYGDTGIGKTSLVPLAPKPVIIPLDQGSDNIRHPLTNEKLPQVNDVNTFADLRAVCQQPQIFANNTVVAIDTITKAEDLCHQYMFDTILHEKGQRVSSIEGYGYGKGYRHLYDTMTLLLMDLDILVRAGLNVVLIAQSISRSIANPGGEDYLREGPRLYPGSKNLPPVDELYCEWANHVLYVGHEFSFVKDKKISGDVQRAIFAQPELHFRAKSRQLKDGSKLPDVISYSDPSDDSLWAFIFGTEKE